MEKITYLLGAGASAQILPLIKDQILGRPGLPTALENFVSIKMGDIVERSSWSQEQFKKLTLIIQKCKSFRTPDLAAKYYLEKKDLGNYLLIKKLISHYFSDFESSFDLTGTGFEGKNIDSRVIPFLTTISEKNKIPKNIKIISWNYDTQIEMGSKELYAVSGVNDFDENFHAWPSKFTDKDKVDKDFLLLHLNGISGYLYSERNLASKIESPFNFSEPGEPLLSFAWEDDSSFNKNTFTEKRIDLAKKMIEGTTVLVVIGYSFPFFNRKIDSQLFSFMRNTLKKIYFQDPVLDGQSLFSQFDLIKDKKEFMEIGPAGRIITEIVHIQNVEQYYVPFEL